MFLNFKHNDIPDVKRYPLRDRAFYALLVFVTLLITTRRNMHFVFSDWRLDSWELIAICSFSVAQLFEPRERWFMLFLGIGIGDVLLYALR